LELGGKSPCIIDKNINLSVAAKKIAWAKSMNAGQTCVAPDYVLIPRDSKESFIKEFSKWITHFYGEDPSTNNEYTAIVSDRHFLRIKNLLEGEKILFGGKENGRKISPTIVETSNFNSKVMKEEIFGPILPVISYEDESEIEGHISNSPNPLALYVFTNSKSWANRILDTTPSGGAVINDLVIHLAHPNLPFGGVRQSGIGNYHGFFGLETFSHMRAELRKPKSKWFDNPVKYPPFNKIKLKIIKIIFGL
jgi:aldehyde dehydrogenase (NAD+)